MCYDASSVVAQQSVTEKAVNAIEASVCTSDKPRPAHIDANLIIAVFFVNSCTYTLFFPLSLFLLLLTATSFTPLTHTYTLTFASATSTCSPQAEREDHVAKTSLFSFLPVRRTGAHPHLLLSVSLQHLALLLLFIFIVDGRVLISLYSFFFRCCCC